MTEPTRPRPARQVKRRSRLRAIEGVVGTAAAELMRGIAMMGGAGLVGYGAWLAWAPAGFIAGGVLLLAGVWLHDRE
ncbi:MAG TPA: hypothetical protein VGR45_15670 [Stellaceae bacterium]|nr:hypothetical protein [Stellaceae bacterium]